MRNYFCIVLIIIIFSCGDEERHSDQINKIEIKDSFAVDIPTDSTGKYEFFYPIKKDMESQMGLPSIETGFDSFQLRIWYTTRKTYKDRLLVIINKNKKWSGRLYSYKEDFNENKRSVIVESIKDVEPKSWEDIRNSISNFGILSLPDSKKILDYEYCLDAEGVTIEVADSKMYRIYNYPCFEFQNDSIWQAQNIKKFVRIIEEEFQ